MLALVPRSKGARLETDHEALLEAQGLAACPGPHQRIDRKIAAAIPKRSRPVAFLKSTINPATRQHHGLDLLPLTASSRACAAISSADPKKIDQVPCASMWLRGSVRQRSQETKAVPTKQAAAPENSSIAVLATRTDTPSVPGANGVSSRPKSGHGGGLLAGCQRSNPLAQARVMSCSLKFSTMKVSPS